MLVHMCVATMYIIRAVPQKVENLPQHPFLDMYPKYVPPKGHLFNYVYSNFIHNSQKLETIYNLDIPQQKTG